MSSLVKCNKFLGALDPFSTMYKGTPLHPMENHDFCTDGLVLQNSQFSTFVIFICITMGGGSSFFLVAPQNSLSGMNKS